MKLLVRGLGVTSSLKAHRISRDEYFIAPRIHSTSKLTYFEPITAFDYYLEANGESIAEYASGISSFSSRPGLHTVEFITNFCSIPEMYNLGHYLTNLLKSDNLYARIPDYLTRSRGKIFPFNWALYNSSEDIDFYANGVELYQQQLPLLHDNRNSTLRLSEITANNGYDALLDRKTIKLLENIGYRTKNNSLPSRFAISSTFGSILYNPKDAKYVSDLDGEMLHGVFG